MTHIVRDKKKLIQRINRIQGQLNAAKDKLEDEITDNCDAILHLIAACRGAMNSLMYEVIVEHVRHHMINPDKNPTSKQSKATQLLLNAIKSYL